jgi:hypothetical protein
MIYYKIDSTCVVDCGDQLVGVQVQLWLKQSEVKQNSAFSTTFMIVGV